MTEKEKEREKEKSGEVHTVSLNLKTDWLVHLRKERKQGRDE